MATDRASGDVIGLVPKEETEVVLPLPSLQSTFHLSKMLASAGIANGIAACATNPIEVVKTRLQVAGELKHAPGDDAAFAMLRQPSIRSIVSDTYKAEGVRGFYRGLKPALLREATYSSLRLGMYDSVRSAVSRMMPAIGAAASPSSQSSPSTTAVPPPSALARFIAGAICGCTAAGLTNPTDLLRVRYQAAGRSSSKPMSSSLWATTQHIYRNEGGIAGLWQGVVPSMQRAALVSAAQIGVYDNGKSYIKARGWLTEGFGLHCAASVAAGLASAIVTTPVDLAKTRLMNQLARQHGAAHTSGTTGRLYKNATDCLLKTYKAEGFIGLYSGFVLQWARLTPHTIITFVALEQIRAWMGVKPV